MRTILAVAVAASALVGCSPDSLPTVASVEASDTAEGHMLRAIKNADQQLYGTVSAKTEASLLAGQPPLRAVASARNDYYRALLKRIPWLSDADAMMERTATLERLRYLQKNDPAACAHASAGDASPSARVLPESMLATEMQRVTAAMSVDMTGPELPSLTVDETMTLVGERLDALPELHPALRQLTAFAKLPAPRPDPSSVDARAMCDANIAVVADALSLPAEIQPKYQRAMVKIGLR